MSSSSARWLLAGLVLVSANVLLVRARRSLVEDGSALRARASELDALARGGRAREEHERRLRDLAARAANVGLDEPIDLAALRDRLLAAEAGLALERLSLDFRPDEEARGPYRGMRVTGAFASDYATLREYLARVERLKLPLTLEAATIRWDDDEGLATLSAQWRGRWVSPGAAPPVPTPEQTSTLAAWLDGRPATPPRRNPFAPVVTEPPPPPAGVVEDAARPLRRASGSDRGPAPDVAGEVRPALAGFVLARPELERDVDRRVLAALRYEGEMRLVARGDRVGAFVVEGIVARESVTLRNVGSGERTVLRLE